jgi:hypothetical protein
VPRERLMELWNLIARPPSGDVARSSGRLGMLMLAAVLAAIVASRVYLMASTDFPINDGALFYRFIVATAATFPGLPATAEFNGWILPFGYPPLSFWLGALLTRLGAAPLDVVHYLPIAMNVVYVLLVAWLLLRSGWSRLFVALAMLFFCARLAGFAWLLAGGGISRGMGSIFMVAALLAVTLPKPGERSDVPHWRMALGGMFVAGAMLSHFEWGALAAASVVASRALGARSFKNWVVDSMIAGVTAIILVTPWFLFILDTHGPAPFFNAGSTSSWNFLRSLLIFLGLGWSGVANPFIALGVVVLLARRNFFWPVFVLLCVFVTPRQAPTPLMVPMGIFAAQGVITAWQILGRLVRPARAAIAVACAMIVILGVNGYRDYQRGKDTFRPLRPELREAMRWVAENHGGARFEVINGRPWASDSSAEWLPVLTGATNTTTVQGREWLPAPIFVRSEALAELAKASTTCEELVGRFGRYGRAQFVWVETMPECFASPAYELVYRNPWVSIFRIRESDRVLQLDRAHEPGGAPF